MSLFAGGKAAGAWGWPLF